MHTIGRCILLVKSSRSTELPCWHLPTSSRPSRPRIWGGRRSDVDEALPVAGAQWSDVTSACGSGDEARPISEHWSPKVIARLNDYEIKVVKLQGEFVWHSHADTDELFLVIDGTLTIQLRDGAVTLGPRQLFVVPRGTEHCPIADGEVAAMLIGPAGVVNTGDASGEAAAGLTAHYDASLRDPA
jgi:mannose-6-phosphate isomerase-like protein (cupin superfamily)